MERPNLKEYLAIGNPTTRFSDYTHALEKYADWLEQQLKQKIKTRCRRRHNIVSDKSIFPEWK